jgi:hypothetical protein
MVMLPTCGCPQTSTKLRIFLYKHFLFECSGAETRHFPDKFVTFCYQTARLVKKGKQHFVWNRRRKITDIFLLSAIN